MFANGFLSISLEGLLGLIVTAVGIWFIVKQLNESRLASQMEGLVTLTEMLMNIRKQSKALDDFTLREEWKQLDDMEAYKTIRQKRDIERDG